MAIASGTCGTCTWIISDAGELSIGPTSGNSGYLLSELIETSWPWQDYAEEVRSAVFSGSIYFYRKQWSGQQPIETGEAQHLFAVLDGLVLSERRYSNLTSITGFGSLKNLTNVSSMFEGCTALTTLDLSSLDTTNVTKMARMFYNCNLLSSVTFGNLFSTENAQGSEPYFGKGTNTTNGIIVQNDSGFMKLTASQRAGTWERGVAPTYSAVAFRTAGGVPDTSGEDVEIDVTWATDASTTTRALKVYKKLSSTTSYPSTADVTRNLSGNSGIESITLANVGSEAYDFKVEFYDGTNTFIAFPAVIANKDLVTLDQSGNLWTAGSVTENNGTRDIDLNISEATIAKYVALGMSTT